MKTLMKKVGGCKKARFWNMARFQPRRWHREQAAAAGNQPHARTASTLQDAGLPPSPRPPLIQPSTNPPIQPPPDLAPAPHERTSATTGIPSPGGEGQGEGELSSNTRLISAIQPLADTPPSSSSSVSSVVNSNSFCKTGIHNELAGPGSRHR